MDVAVIGAGAAGCVTALAFARRGAQVLLLEAHPGASTRLAGEWLHPAGVRVLDALGLGGLADHAQHPPGRGFLVFPADDGPPVRLDYPGGAFALTCDHARLVAALREAAAAHPHVTYLPFAHPTRLEGQRLTFERGGHAPESLVVRDVVGADGRSAVSRKWLGLRDDRVPVSCTAGLLLEDTELPEEGFGHLVLTAPGPAFIYRIGPRHLRACLDVPSGLPGGDHAAYLWRAYSAALPEQLRPAFRRALETRPITWATNYFRARAAYGRPGLALVGDAVGHFHPLTAVGLTLGFQDGECLARSATFEAYRRERTALSHVPEIMAMVLYEVFAARDGGARALHDQTFRMLRASVVTRNRTMRLLAAEEPGVLSFSRPFLTAAAMTTARVVHDVIATQRLPHGMRVLLYLHRRLTWLAMQALIGVLRPSGGPGTRQLSAMLSGVARIAAPVAARARVQPVLVEVAPATQGRKHAS
jgi:2-polyprenyl-6-methoxyphenol hydroxylase-like FAD-dependent oxidoreductase